MYEQMEFEITYSNITKLEFVRCRDCDQDPVCPHAVCREGCRTIERIIELNEKKSERKRIDAGD